MYINSYSACKNCSDFENPITKCTPVTHCLLNVCTGCPGGSVTSMAAASGLPHCEQPSSFISLYWLEWIHPNAEVPPDFQVCISAFCLCPVGKQGVGSTNPTPLFMSKDSVLRFLVEKAPSTTSVHLSSTEEDAVPAAGLFRCNQREFFSIRSTASSHMSRLSDSQCLLEALCRQSQHGWSQLKILPR